MWGWERSRSLLSLLAAPHCKCGCHSDGPAHTLCVSVTSFIAQPVLTAPRLPSRPHKAHGRFLLAFLGKNVLVAAY